MRRRFRIMLIAFLVVVVAGGLIWLAASSGGGAENPIYHGRRLTRWLDQAYTYNPPDSAAVTAAEEALRGLGTNALPCLIALAASDTDSTAKQRFFSRLELYQVPGIRVITDNDRHQEAIEGFKIVHAVAKPVLPALSKMLNDPKTCKTAAEILREFNTDAFDALTNAMPNTNEFVRQNAMTDLAAMPLSRNSMESNSEVKAIVSILSNYLSDTNATSRDRATRYLERFAGKSGDVVPTLIHELSDGDSEVRYSAARVLAQSGTNGGPAVAVLIQKLSDTHREEHERAEAAYFLSDFGTNARPAVPALLQSLTNSGFSTNSLFTIQIAAAGALKVIEPESAEPVAVAALIHSLTNEDYGASRNIAEALRVIDPAAAVRALIQELSDTNGVVRAQTASLLTHFGTNAGPAVPALIHSLADQDSAARSSAAAALKMIDPEAAAQAGVK